MKHYPEELPLYAAGQLDSVSKTALEKHLAICPTCRAELDFWRAVSCEITTADAQVSAPVGLAGKALERVRVADAAATKSRQARVTRQIKSTWRQAFSLLRAQAYLVKGELWPASAGVMALGVIAALVSRHVEALPFIAPLVAAAGMAMLYNPEVDPAYELALATPTSAWKILLARLSIVSVYNLLLSLLASLAMLLVIPLDVLGILILGWLAPMAFLSSLALLLSLWIGPGSATLLAYGLWMVQFLQSARFFGGRELSPGWDEFLRIYLGLWHSPGLLLVLSAVFLAAALYSSRYCERNLA